MIFFFFSSRRRHTRLQGDWSSDVCSSDLPSTRKTAACLPVFKSHRRIVPSPGLPPEIALPSGPNATLHTGTVWLVIWRSSLPVSASHSRTVLSRPPDSTRLPSGDSAALMTPSVWPSKTRSCLPVSASHSRSVLSELLVSRRLPSADTETLPT